MMPVNLLLKAEKVMIVMSEQEMARIGFGVKYTGCEQKNNKNGTLSIASIIGIFERPCYQGQQADGKQLKQSYFPA